MKVAIRQIPNLDQKSLNYLNDILVELAAAINSIEFGNGTTRENMWIDFQSVPGAAADVEQTVSHNLGRTPIGFVPISMNASGSWYLSSTAATSATIYIKCDTTNTSGSIMIL